MFLLQKIIYPQGERCYYLTTKILSLFGRIIGVKCKESSVLKASTTPSASCHPSIGGEFGKRRIRYHLTFLVLACPGWVLEGIEKG